MGTTRDSKRILSVTVRRMFDEYGDTSWLGKYSDDPGDFAIVVTGEYEGEFVSDLPCECGHVLFEHGEDDASEQDCRFADCDCENFDQVGISRGREYRYFNPGNIDSSIPDDEQRKYAQQDYQRMRDLNRGEWCFIGITSEAQVQLGSDLIQTIHSGGLWGIESDSEDSFLSETEGEQLDELREQLHAIGFSKRAIAAAFRNVERKDL